MSSSERNYTVDPGASFRRKMQRLAVDGDGSSSGFPEEKRLPEDELVKLNVRVRESALAEVDRGGNGTDGFAAGGE